MKPGAWVALGACTVVLIGCGSASSGRGAPTAGVRPARTLLPGAPKGGRDVIPTPIYAPGHKPTPFPTLDPHKPRPVLPTVHIPTPTAIPAADFTATVSGTVSDARTHRPLAGVVVTLGTKLRSAVTSADGRYSMRFPAGPSEPIIVSKSGYSGGLAMGSLAPHGTARVNFALKRVVKGHGPPPPPAPVTFGQG